jgi:CheY-like chemotaxis protein
MPGTTVLIVDDDDDVRFVFSTACRLRGLDVVGEAADGFEAIALADYHQPNVVLLDLMMPKLAGDEALRLIRDVAPNARVILMSAIDAYLLREIGTDVCADAVAEKTNIQKVLALVDELAAAHFAA